MATTTHTTTTAPATGLHGTHGNHVNPVAADPYAHHNNLHTGTGTGTGTGTAATAVTPGLYSRGVAASRWLRTILGLLFVASVVELALVADLLDEIDGFPSDSGIKRRYRYTLFVSIFSLLGSLILLILSLLRRRKPRANSAHTTTTGTNTHTTTAGAKSDSNHHLGTKAFLIINFILWTVAGSLIEARLGNFASKKVRASSAFAWIPAVLSLIGIPLAFHLWRRSKRANSHLVDGTHHHNSAKARV